MITIIHCGTWLHHPIALVKRLDYVTTRIYISMLVTLCRVYTLFDTDTYMVKMTLKYPSPKKEQKTLVKYTRSYKATRKLGLSYLCHDQNFVKQYSVKLEGLIDSDNISSDIESLINSLLLRTCSIEIHGTLWG